MLSLALYAVALFLALTVTSAGRERTYGYYLRHYRGAGRARRASAQAARAVSWLFSALFYLCVAGAVAGLIYAAVLVGASGFELIGTFGGKPG